ncbi:MAG: alpha/beta hydrolase [Myxococcota bacterium]
MTPVIEHKQVQANGIRYHVASTGDVGKPALLCLHGFPEGWMSWRPIMERLADRFHVVVPDMRGYGQTDKPAHGYDPLTLSDDVHALINVLGLQKPALLGHDWGGAVAWICGHRFGAELRHLVVVNCTHPRTLLSGILRGEDLQPLRSIYMAYFQVPRVPEMLMTVGNGALLRRGFKLAEGRKGAMDRGLVAEIIATFATPHDLTGPLNYYREAARMQLSADGRRRMEEVYRQPVGCPITMIWGTRDHFLSEKVARRSHEDAHRSVAWVGLPGVGHFVSLEAPDELASELERVLG